MTDATVHGFDALEALRAAIEETRIPREVRVPESEEDRRQIFAGALRGEVADTKALIARVPHVTKASHAGFLELGMTTLRSLPGVNVIAEGLHPFLHFPVALFEYEGERWIGYGDKLGVILNLGDGWEGLVASGRVLAP
jgi:hypothetical protein